MNKRGFGLITLIVVGVAALVFGGLVGGQVVAQAGLAPKLPDTGIGGPGGSGIINAHACSADETCEVNNLQALSVEVIGPNSADLILEAQNGNSWQWQSSSSGFFNLILNSGESLPVQITPEGIILINGGALFIEDTRFEDTAEFLADVRVRSQLGNGTAYACLESDGNLVRSQTPCV